MSDLRGAVAPKKVETSASSKILGAGIIAVVVAAAAAYTYEAGMWNAQPPQKVAMNELPSPTLPSATQAALPPQPAVVPPAPETNAAQNTLEKKAPPPVRTARRREPDATQVPSAIPAPQDNTPAQQAPSTTPPANTLSAQPPSAPAPQPQTDTTPQTNSPQNSDQQNQQNTAAPQQPQ